MFEFKFMFEFNWVLTKFQFVQVVLVCMNFFINNNNNHFPLPF